MRFISLGYDCYAKKALKKINLEGISFPFDNIITPIESLIKLLQNNFNNFLIQTIPLNYILRKNCRKIGLITMDSMPRK